MEFKAGHRVFITYFLLWKIIEFLIHCSVDKEKLQEFLLFPGLVW